MTSRHLPEPAHSSATMSSTSALTASSSVGATNPGERVAGGARSLALGTSGGVGGVGGVGSGVFMTLGMPRVASTA